MEDLTPQPSSRPWWSMLNFNNCCRPEDDTEDDDKNYTYLSKKSNTLKITTDDGKVVDEASRIDTPITACSDGSSGEYTMMAVYSFNGCSSYLQLSMHIMCVIIIIPTVFSTYIPHIITHIYTTPTPYSLHIHQ